MSEYMLEAKGIIKTFPGVKALSGVDLRIKKGEVHALVGENGAGKSTLMLTLGGIYKPDSGTIYLDGEEVHFDSPNDANQKGISVVYQELSLIQGLSVAENIFANRQPVKMGNIIDVKTLHKNTREMLALFNADHIDPAMLVKELSIANQQVVEILKAMSFNPKILVLDEPTSSLTEAEVKQLFTNIRVLKSKGISCIYISHHLHEIFEIADTVTVLRDGQYVADARIEDIDEEFLVTKMVGRKIENIFGSRSEEAKIGEVLFEAQNIGRKGAFKNISFNIRAGEIVGFAGLVGAGRTEVGRAIFGAEPIDTGKLCLEGQEINIKTCKQAIEKGIGYLSEDRKTQGLYLEFCIKNNLPANRLSKFSEKGFLKEDRIEENAHSVVKAFGVATPSVHQFIKNLSGGNQQKVLVAKWVGICPKLLIVDEPTRGVDVGAKSEIYTILRNLAAKGVAIMVISSDLPEVLGITDRVIVMKEGQIVGELGRQEANEEKVIALAAGIGKSKKGA
ncbi:sugar ABC transporter ATP-binding protein [Cellulosilyticum sp. I15G10I2]|uniref:sugar ABC transporter ATP-binding protein n=1 Tax=Cellulosilyticum sp. I15G10I2 TaxID=1892843 RepID=UPI0009F39CC5|nr:sugar ABC transporter ATP-binding protein [Cellulosilyticum sp. I15G10I2]